MYAQAFIWCMLSARAHILLYVSFFFLTKPATTEIYTLSLHDALPILILFEPLGLTGIALRVFRRARPDLAVTGVAGDRKSTRLNSSHRCSSYAVFCLKKKHLKPRPAVAGMGCRVESRQEYVCCRPSSS